jgi:exodeoxyribonuclease V beta subunit
VRLLYVALTRARNRCYVVWGHFKNAGTSAPAWLLHPPGAHSDGMLERMNSHFKSLDDAAMRRHLQQLVAVSANANGETTIHLQDLPLAETQPYRPVATDATALNARAFTGAIERDWRVTSFSALATHQRDEQPDYDPAGETPRQEAAAGGGIFAFPRGTKAGTCLHKIFEELDFTMTDDAVLDRIVRDQLRAHGFDEEEFSGALTESVRRTVRVPLDPARPHFTLSSVAGAHRLTELEFSFPLKRTSPALLQKLLAGAGDGTSFDRLTFDPVRGYMQGFIDLIFQFEGRFYVVDWKSNWLGDRIEDYHLGAMRREMNERLYPLQYHLYTLALHQYLALRLPDYDYEKHFGGVIYLFVRGLDPARPEFGVFRERPAAELIARLSERLIDNVEGAPS